MSAFEDQSGKISSKLFRQIIEPQSGRKRDEVITGPGFGVDTAVIDLGNGNGLATSSDPVSLIPLLGLKESAWLSVHLLVNDMATTGFAPQYVQFVLNLPADFPRDSFEQYWKYIHEFCDDLGIAITGGHTAQVPGQESTTPGGGTMFLQAPLDEIITSDGAEPGDKIVVTKESALVSSSILAKSFPETVKEECGPEIYEQACENFYRTSSLQDALEATKVLAPKTELKAMHDVTEGGLLGGITELAEASGCGFRVDSDKLPVGEAPQKICELFEIDHRLCVGAGSMIMAVAAGKEEALVNYLNDQSIPATVVGELTEKSEATILIEDGKEDSFKFDGNDPYWNAFFKAMEKGWE
ncbi:AIR synthase [Aliifodinibius salipaludis]|uniref:AIR synthase n=1 Tax=Fodinibius salipaludis TaxID=2032627 RepID=A0A2A2GBL6_9BACT|nr:AIR synthase family protein [Aliifodinibius salipaludis]PAU94580.1 AIR synthase [Aliifodinibius salipaludis]